VSGLRRRGCCVPPSVPRLLRALYGPLAPLCLGVDDVGRACSPPFSSPSLFYLFVASSLGFRACFFPFCCRLSPPPSSSRLSVLGVPVLYVSRPLSSALYSFFAPLRVGLLSRASLLRPRSRPVLFAPLSTHQIAIQHTNSSAIISQKREKVSYLYLLEIERLLKLSCSASPVMVFSAVSSVVFPGSRFVVAVLFLVRRPSGSVAVLRYSRPVACLFASVLVLLSSRVVGPFPFAPPFPPRPHSHHGVRP